MGTTFVTEHSPMKVLMFPWFAYGHITPSLDVAKKLSDTGFLVYLCSTSINLKSIHNKITEKYSTSIQLIEYQLPEFPELPPKYHTTNGLPHHLTYTLHKASKLSKPNFSKILEDLKPDLVIYDVLHPWAEVLANEQNIPAVTFLTSGAAVASYFHNMMNEPDVEFPFSAIYLTKFELQQFNEMMAKSAKEGDGTDDVDPFAKGDKKKILLNTSRVIESKYIDYLNGVDKWKVIPVGLPIQDSIIDDGEDELINWLGKKEENSTVFVSFGSEFFLTKEVIEEIAFGLELSNVNFIWVVRFPKGEELALEEVLPKGFLERNGERGKVVDKWVPQSRILNHSSIGGFLSHCGWNSMLESIDFEVPIIAMPMHLDQPINARLIVELGVAIEIARDDDGKFRRNEIAKALKDVMTDEMGEVLRIKIKNISKNLKGARCEERDELVEELIQHCKSSTKSK